LLISPNVSNVLNELPYGLVEEMESLEHVERLIDANALGFQHIRQTLSTVADQAVNAQRMACPISQGELRTCDRL
jgi:hypothetical protein